MSIVFDVPTVALILMLLWIVSTIIDYLSRYVFRWWHGEEKYREIVEHYEMVTGEAKDPYLLRKLREFKDIIMLLYKRWFK